MHAFLLSAKTFLLRETASHKTIHMNLELMWCKNFPLYKNIPFFAVFFFKKTSKFQQNKHQRQSLITSLTLKPFKSRINP
jgi:hypothetical protein